MVKVLVIIPAWNESNVISKTIKSIPSFIGKKIKIDKIVIDDGSTDKTFEIVSRLHIPVIRHYINRGLGAALATGFEYAKSKNYQYVITFDADGQHLWVDAANLLKMLLTDQADVVIGNRFATLTGLPLMRICINKLSNILTWLLYSIYCNDTQSGLRAFNGYALQKIKLKSQRMEVSSEILKEIRRSRLRLAEMPITGIYTRYSLHKGQQISNAPNVVYKLLLDKFT